MASTYSFPANPSSIRIRAEFEEMPCLRLTVAQAARLFGLSVAECRRALAGLLRTRFLMRDANGQFYRPGQVAVDRTAVVLPRPDRQRLASARLPHAAPGRARA